jgi:triphosphoribosyl-dephospho-CoA synthetase
MQMRTGVLREEVEEAEKSMFTAIEKGIQTLLV